MNQKIINESIRYSPLALALALFAVLALLSLEVRAQEAEGEVGTVETRDERTEPLFGERNMERFMEQAQSIEFSEQMERGAASLEEEKRVQIEMMRALQEERRESFEKKKDEIIERIETRKEEQLTHQQERTQRLEAQAQVRLSMYTERIVQRMISALDRMYAIAERTTSRIRKMEDEGMDMEMASVRHSEVYALIDRSYGYVGLIGEVTVAVLDSENPGDRRSEIRESVTLAKESIQAVHRALKEVIYEMKRATPLEGAGEDADDN